MNESEARAKLERTLGRISLFEWRHLKRAWLGGEVLSSDRVARDAEENWQEFKDFAKEHLRLLRSYEDDKRRAERGELEPETETNTDLSRDQPADVSSSLGDRTFARAMALSSLNRLHAGETPTQRALIHSTHKPRGGVDGTLPQWVIFMGVEAWVPAEEVKEAYRRHQQALLAEHQEGKTQERTFQVAKFVWDEERIEGERPSWPELCRRWNNWPLTEPFENWRAFRMCFLRGEKAVPPQYRMSPEQMKEAVRGRTHEGAFDLWVSSFRE
jgi:hypothetical protein